SGRGDRLAGRSESARSRLGALGVVVDQTRRAAELGQGERGRIRDGALADGVPNRGVVVELVDVQVWPVTRRVKRAHVGTLNELRACRHGEILPNKRLDTVQRLDITLRSLDQISR